MVDTNDCLRGMIAAIESQNAAEFKKHHDAWQLDTDLFDNGDPDLHAVLSASYRKNLAWCRHVISETC